MYLPNLRTFSHWIWTVAIHHWLYVSWFNSAWATRHLLAHADPQHWCLELRGDLPTTRPGLRLQGQNCVGHWHVRAISPGLPLQESRSVILLLFIVIDHVFKAISTTTVLLLSQICIILSSIFYCKINYVFEIRNGKKVKVYLKVLKLQFLSFL